MAIYSELAIAEESATVICVLAEAQSQAEMQKQAAFWWQKEASGMPQWEAVGMGSCRQASQK